MSRTKNKRKKSKRYASTLRQDAPYAYEEASTGSTTGLHPDLIQYALTKSSQIPPSIRKYWNHRTTLFSYFDGSSPSGKLPLLDEQSWFSVTPESIAARIAQRCRSGVILDAFCGAGGNAIQFALTCQHVIAIDIDPIKLLLAKHNAEVYGVSENITFLLGDWRDFVGDYHKARNSVEYAPDPASKWLGRETFNVDVIFLSPPWGGIDYREPISDTPSSDRSANEERDAYDYYPLARLEPDGGAAMYKLARSITPSICMYLPRTINLNDLATLARDEEKGGLAGSSFVDVEEQWMGHRCKAVSCYFGPLSTLTTP